MRMHNEIFFAKFDEGNFIRYSFVKRDYNTKTLKVEEYTNVIFDENTITYPYKSQID